MTNNDVPSTETQPPEPDAPAMSPFERVRAQLKTWHYNRKAKQKAMLTECGQTLTPDQKALKIGFGLLFEALTLVLGLIFLWFNALFFFLQNERVELSGLKPSAALWFSEKFDGQSADMKSFEVQYRKADAALALVAKDAVIRGEGGDALLTLPSMDTQFDLRDLIFGTFTPTQTRIEGGAVTVKYLEDKSVQFGLGTPDSFESLGADITVGGKSGGSGAVTQSGQGDWKRVERVLLKDVNVYVINTPNNVTHHLRDVNGAYEYGDEVLEAAFTASLSAQTPVPLQIAFSADDTFELVKINMKTQGLNPAELNAQTGAFPRLATLNAPIDADFDLTLGKAGRLDGLSVDISAGSGSLEGKGAPTPFQSAKLSADYDAATSAIKVRRALFASRKMTIDASGDITPDTPGGALAINEPFNLDMEIAGFQAEAAPSYGGPFAANAGRVTMRIDPAFREAGLKRFLYETDRFTVDLSGEIAGKPKDGPFELSKLKLAGNIQGALTERDVLQYWPPRLAPVSRAWVERSVLKADVSRIDIQTDITDASLERGYLTDEEFSMAFPVRNAGIKFISTMTPMTGASGSGLLRGNSFSIGVDTAALGEGISVFDSRVDIPQFMPLGAPMTVNVNAQGALTPLLSFIDEPPFNYASRFGIKPEEFSGGGVVNYVFTRPVGMPERKDLMSHTVNADFVNVTAPIKIGPHKIENGQLKFSLDGTGLSLKGPVNVGPWPAQFSLTDSFDDGSGNADFNLSGTMTRDDFDRLGFGFREYFSGDVDVNLAARGEGLIVSGAKITADLTRADLHFGDLWSKPSGQVGTLAAMLSKTPDGGTQISDMALNAAGLNLQGSAKFGSDYRLLSLNLPVARLDGFINSAVVASTPQAGELALTMRGNYLNIDPWVTAALAADNDNESFPLGLTGEFDRLSLRGDLDVDAAKLSLKNSDAGLESLSLSGTRDGEPLSISVTPGEAGTRLAKIDIPDAGAALKTVFNFKNVTGGNLLIDAKLPPAGAPGPAVGTARVTDFKLADAPVFARILSLASLTGLGEVLSGDGMNFEKMTAPFEYEDRQLRLTEARASGPAIGITASGDIDFDGKTMDVAGVLVPAYTFNSVLGNVPLLGDIVVGKKGEGMFALNYSVAGPFEKTQIAVNPLSAFAPGFLRRIFDRPLPAKPAKTPDTPKVE